ncbi:MAG: hypothetical protein AB7E52_06025 [Bdellovibrionales bacterium]
MAWNALFGLESVSYPDPVAFIPHVVLFFLACASFVDARTGRVPDWLIAAGLLIAFGSLAWFAGWWTAGQLFLWVLVAVCGLWLVNRLYVWLAGHDAFGFGDAKWTGLAVAGFGLVPVAWAWAIAAWLALVWLGVRWLWRKVSPAYCGHVYVHFAPFLFFGLLLVLYKDALLALGAHAP